MFIPIHRQIVIAGASAIMMVALAAGSLALSGCKPLPPEEQAAQDQSDAKRDTAAERDFVSKSLVYTWDARSHLCFASRDAGQTSAGVITQVPCTAEVLALIVKENS